MKDNIYKKIDLRNQNVIIIESKKQMDKILKQSPGCGEAVDIIMIHESIKDIIKTEKYLPIWAALFAAANFDKSKVYYYTN